MIIDCHHKHCPNSFKGMCERSTNNEFRCQSEEGQFIDKKAPCDMKAILKKETEDD